MPAPPATRITSRQHAIVRRFREAARRADADVVLLDGEHLLADALDAGVRVDAVLTGDRPRDVVMRARQAGALVYEASDGVLEAASPVRTPSGIVALARWRTASLDDVVTGRDADAGVLVLGLCGVQDPGNVGSAIRASDALGASGLLALEGTADPGGWKALRGSMGSAFRLPIGVGRTADAMTAARKRGLRIVATVAADGEPVGSTDLTPPTLLLLGSEGAGLPEDVVAGADARVTIPMRPESNSLNVAAAAAVILYEARRQRATRK